MTIEYLLHISEKLEIMANICKHFTFPSLAKILPIVNKFLANIQFYINLFRFMSNLGRKTCIPSVQVENRTTLK